MDNLDFLDEAPASQDATPAPEAQEAAPESQPRDESGRFAPKVEEPAPEPQPELVAQPEPQPEARQPEAPVVPPGYVPVSALQELRTEIRALKQQPQEQPVIPDAYDDPEGFAAYQNAAVQSAIYGQNLTWSRRIAEMQHKPETVQQAHDWAFQKCESDPIFNMRVASSNDPYGVVMEEWRRDQLLSQVQPADLDNYLAWKAAQAQAQQQTQSAAQPAIPQSPAPPPPSLASAPSAGGPQAIPIGQEAAFDAAFK